jgi:hypothetical protein
VKLLSVDCRITGNDLIRAFQRSEINFSNEIDTISQYVKSTQHNNMIDFSKFLSHFDVRPESSILLSEIKLQLKGMDLTKFVTKPYLRIKDFLNLIK